MFKKWIRLIILFILDKTGLFNNRLVQDFENFKNEHFRDDGHFKWNRSNTVDGTWREVHEEEAEAEPEPDTSETVSPEPEPSYTGSIQDNIREISRAAEGIRHPKIRELAFHVLIIAKDIIYEHDIGNNKCQNYSQFENYYVPTLKSVITNYYTIETKGMINPQIQEDVQSYLNSCGDAFTTLYNSMFNDDIMTMEVEMEAMDIIMKRDGLL